MTTIYFEYENFEPCEKMFDTMSAENRIWNLAGNNIVDDGAWRCAENEVVREWDDDMVEHKFVWTACEAFKLHCGLRINPQDIHMLIQNALAQHVKKHPELRSKIVNHDGKKTLECRRNGFTRTRKALNDWNSCWLGEDGFLAQLEGDVKQNEDGGKVVPSFSTMTAICKSAAAIGFMDITSEFYEFLVSSRCGFATIGLYGKESDWLLLLTNTEALLRQYCTEDWASEWSFALLPLLKKILLEFQNAANGKPGDQLFWNSMAKRGGWKGSGGDRRYINGWINILFPFNQSANKEQKNPHMKPYSPDAAYVLEGKDKADAPGDKLTNFTNGIYKVPVKWDYFGKIYPLHVRAGFVGCKQHADYSLESVTAWFMQYENPDDAPVED